MSWLGKKRAPPIRSLVGEGMVVSGSLRFRDGLRIDGQVTGDVIAEGEGRSILVISDNARVHGRVSASHVIISGEVRGPVHSTEMLELQPKARVRGDVHYKALEIHLGATLDGKLEHSGALGADGQRGNLKLAANNT